MRRIYLLSILCLALGSAPASAAENERQLTQAPFGTASDDQIEVTADESLEWHQEGRFYLAKGNARATRGSMTVEADILTAYEREKESDAPASGSSLAGGNINRLTAEGHVRLADSRGQVFGDRAEYDLDARVAKVTGKNLRYVTEKDVVTARDSLEYHEGQNIAVARGKAVAVHDQRRIEADVMTARFTQGPKGQMEMSDMTAEGHVTVITGNDISRGNKAVYDMKRNVAMMLGNVRVTRGDTQLSGERAEVDFNKGESRLLSGDKGGRVRALLVPKSGQQ